MTPSDQNIPHDIRAEQAYLGSLVVCPISADQKRMMAGMSADSFFQPDHQEIFKVVAALAAAGTGLDYVTVHASLKGNGVLADVGGAAYLAEIFGTMPNWAHGKHYGEIVEDLAQRRRALGVADAMSRRLKSPASEEVFADLLQASIRELMGIGRARTRVEVFTMAQMLEQFIAQKMSGRAAAQLTGVRVLDEYPGIFGYGKYTIVAGRPSMGKSTFVRWILGLWAMAGTPVGLVAVEEDRMKIGGNYLSAMTEIENDTMAYRELNANQWAKVRDAADVLGQTPWHGVDAAFTLSEVTASVEALVVEHGCKVVAVDHIHLVKWDQRSENEQREIKEISRALKELAKSLEIVLIAAAQLNRPADRSSVPPPPTLTDLRASGAIEEHADGVIFLHREDYYRPTEDPTGDCEIHIAKNRNGRKGRCRLAAELNFQRFADLPIGTYEDLP